MVYDITRRDTFAYLDQWLTECRENSDKEATIVVVGNKCDLDDQRQVSVSEGERFAEEHGITFLETSAKTAVNVEEVSHSNQHADSHLALFENLQSSV